jgi:hypothetical protein
MLLTATPMIIEATTADHRLSSRSAAHSAAVPAITAITTEAATSTGL